MILLEQQQKCLANQKFDTVVNGRPTGPSITEKKVNHLKYVLKYITTISNIKNI